LRKSLLLTYLDSQVWISAIEDQIVRALGEILEGVPLVIAGDHAKTRFLALRLAERRADVTILAAEPELSSPDPSSLASISLAPRQVSIGRVEYNSERAGGALSEARVVVVWPQFDPWFDRELAKHLRSGTYMLDAGIGSILAEAQETARAQQVQLLRVNVWPTLAGALSAAHESARVFGAAFGGEQIAGVTVIAGGALGQYGDVVVDSVHQPTRVIGVADGRGGVLFNYGEDERQSVLKVSEEIHRKLLTPRLEADA
jgi:hypothetical protein